MAVLVVGDLAARNPKQVRHVPLGKPMLIAHGGKTLAKSLGIALEEGHRKLLLTDKISNFSIFIGHEGQKQAW